jgi:hypothetical protein
MTLRNVKLIEADAAFPALFWRQGSFLAHAVAAYTRVAKFNERYPIEKIAGAAKASAPSP